MCLSTGRFKILITVCTQVSMLLEEALLTTLFTKWQLPTKHSLWVVGKSKYWTFSWFYPFITKVTTEKETCADLVRNMNKEFKYILL